jgi:hypothetical protein
MTGFGFAKGKELAVEHVQIVALYEADSGEIRHIHTVTTIRGAQRITQDEAIAEAKKSAARHHKNVEAFSIALSEDAAHSRSPHRIDPKTKGFVPVLPNK